MRVLVTGVTGFTGGHLARALVRRGYAVRGLVRRREQIPALEASGIEPSVGRLQDRSAVAAAVKNVDVVYHIAALYRQAGLPRETYVTVNSRSVGWLIEAAASAGVGRLVHCSTVGVHGDIEHPPATLLAW